MNISPDGNYAVVSGKVSPTVSVIDINKLDDVFAGNIEPMERDIEPVYRGAFWKVGSRLTYRAMDFVEPWSTRRMLRLCYAEDGKRFVAGEGTIENGQIDPGGQRSEVRGFVPRQATGYWIEEVGENGDVRTLNSWGDIGSFWRP